MIFLIRYRDSAKGNVYDVKMSSARITLGSGLNQHIHLPGDAVKEAHAKIKMESGAPVLSALAGSRVFVDGEPVRRARLNTGGLIEIGNHQIRLIAAPGGFDFAAEVTLDREELQLLLQDSWHKEIKPQTFTPRRMAYGLSLLLVVGMFLLPFAAYLQGTGEQYQWLDLMTAMEDAEQQGWRGDSLWSPGPLLPAHRNTIGNNCTTCHTDAFQPVADTACATCHNQSDQHFDASFTTVAGLQDHEEVYSPILIADAMAAAVSGIQTALPRCESCHKEHNEPQTLIASTDSLCTQCHEESVVTAAGAITQTATAFNLAGHPEFRYTLLVADGQQALPADEAFLASEVNSRGQALWRRVRQLTGESVVEDSNLEFSHELHLQLDEPSLACSNCHQLDVDNEHFQPIAMEDHCADCHTLEFNGREIPHGDPVLAIRSIEEYFIALYVSPDFEADVPPRRLPGRLERTCEGSDYECAVAQAELEIELQFNNSGCVTCHQVTAVATSDVASLNRSSPLTQSWIVEPVRINSDWYENTRFDHASHLTQTGQSENVLCSNCHQAQSSSLSGDILIPRIETCLDCHSDRTENNSVKMACVDCHLHHPRQRVRQSQFAQGPDEL